MAYRIKSPILLITFDRIDTTTQILAAIRHVKPARLYVYADAPRSKKEEANCANVRALIKDIDWPCDVRTLYPEQNLGPRVGVASAISWFFQHEESGIILEHDCLPSKEFFRYCDYLLDYYRDDTRIMHVAGTSPYNDKSIISDYYMLRIPLIWGWASWRRAWSAYDLRMKDLDSFVKSRGIEAAVNGVRSQANWLHYFRAAASGAVNTWDYQWSYAVMRNHGLCITPSTNMISNIGFGEHSLHSTNTRSRFAALPHGSPNWPLRHPEFLLPVIIIEERLNKDVFRFRTIKYVLNSLGLGERFSTSQSAMASVKRLRSMVQSVMRRNFIR